MSQLRRDDLDLLEVILPRDESFRVVRETLTRIGVPSLRDGQNTLYQSCHILARQSKTKYYIVHFKEMFALDGKIADISDEDIRRRNKIALLLESWGFLDIKDKTKMVESGDVRVKVISHTEKSNWNLVPKYNIGMN